MLTFLPRLPVPPNFPFISYNKVSQKAVSKQDVTNAVSLPLFFCM